MDKVKIQDLQDWLEAIQMDLARPAKRTDTLEFDGLKGLRVTGMRHFYFHGDFVGSKRTIYLLYPDHATDDYGHDLYAAWADEPDFKEALKKAKLEAAMAQHEGKMPDKDEDGEYMWRIPPQDFALLMAFPGHLSDTYSQHDDLDNEDEIPLPE